MTSNGYTIKNLDHGDMHVLFQFLSVYTSIKVLGKHVMMSFQWTGVISVPVKCVMTWVNIVYAQTLGQPEHVPPIIKKRLYAFVSYNHPLSPNFGFFPHYFDKSTPVVPLYCKTANHARKCCQFIWKQQRLNMAITKFSLKPNKQQQWISCNRNVNDNRRNYWQK